MDEKESKLLKDKIEYTNLLIERKNKQMKFIKELFDFKLGTTILKDWYHAHSRSIKNLEFGVKKLKERLTFYKDLGPSEKPSPSLLAKNSAASVKNSAASIKNSATAATTAKNSAASVKNSAASIKNSATAAATTAKNSAAAAAATARNSVATDKKDAKK